MKLYDALKESLDNKKITNATLMLSDRPTMEDIRELAMDNVIIAGVYKSQRNHQLTDEEMLILMIQMLADHSTEIRKQFISCKLTCNRLAFIPRKDS